MDLPTATSINSPGLSQIAAKFESGQNAHLKKLRDEIQQPYIFRDRNLIAAENALLFEDFYEGVWQQLNIIASAIGTLSRCGANVQERL